LTVQPAERRRSTEDEYVALERLAETKSELVNGEIDAMSGAKPRHYRTIPSFVEYVLVAQRRRQVEHFRRLETGQWLLTVLEGDDAILELSSLGCAIPLREIYAETDELPGDEAGAGDPPT
jgi:hypothetical protein